MPSTFRRRIIDEALKALGKRLQRYRGARSQQQVAEHVGVTVQSVSNWENGVHEPTPTHIEELADLYKVTPDELYGIGAATQQESAQAPVLPPTSVSPVVQTRLLNISRIRESDLPVLDRVIEALLASHSDQAESRKVAEESGECLEGSN